MKFWYMISIGPRKNNKEKYLYIFITFKFLTRLFSNLEGYSAAILFSLIFYTLTFFKLNLITESTYISTGIYMGNKQVHKN